MPQALLHCLRGRMRRSSKKGGRIWRLQATGARSDAPVPGLSVMLVDKDGPREDPPKPWQQTAAPPAPSSPACIV